MATEQPKLRDQRHLRITSDKLRALLHEAWKKGNDSYLDHAKPDGADERYAYVDQVMIDKGYKRQE